MGVEQKVKNDVNTLNLKEIDKLLNIIKTVNYGSVTVVIQEGRIVQIEKNEKMRIR